MSPQVFTLPDLGEGLSEAELVRWLVKVGDTVAIDEVVAEVETAKASVEVPTPFAGVVVELHGTEGSTIDVGAPLISVAADTDTAAATYVEEERAGSGNVLIGYGTSAPPAGRRGRRARRADAPARPAGAERPRVRSPLVRQLARKHGIDLATLPGTGPDGLITRADVERAATPETPPANTSTDARTGLPIKERVAVRGVRKAVTQTLARSRSEIPEATTWVDVDATALLEMRAAMAVGDERPPGMLAILARFVVAGLARFPELNSRVDTEREEIQHLDGVNLGIAAQTDRGLLVPSIRGAHELSIRGLDAEIRRLTAAARDGSATATDLSGGSFTLNNYGVLGVDGSAAIINHPEVAILGIGRIIERPWVVEGTIVPRHITQLSLVFDHRVCDGGTAGGFLRYVADAVEAPVRALADV
ncbi:dihydrolipoamide acetyltransferase family protein [Pseudonocardia sp. TRM90224]|uniref:dihydrolipoamide acetyltransferase family protein n=1 Tax=Pseudonocardia sp. TRM90224 TaxID=2812678 RepID=UPI001E601F6F|nr:dihydrolipoamide acetyltransferase family protein [Pseudonocardia sp. TRM90224]